MTTKSVIPTTYAQWRECIEVRCKIPLTPTFIRERLAELENGTHPKTKTFETLYGTDHLQRTIAWFRQAGDEAPEKQPDA